MHKQGLFPVDCQETPAETDSRTSELTGARTQEEGTTRLAHPPFAYAKRGGPGTAY